MWPVSRQQHPKQFADLFGDACLFMRTLELVADRSLFAAPIIVANADHKFLVLDILARLKIEDATILLEPIGRNTAAAAFVAMLAEKEASQSVAHLVLASDHIIAKPDVFLDLVRQARATVEAGHYALFGITPERPEIGFGYIIPGAALGEASGNAIERFVEKPPEDVARDMIAKGALWNSGIFFYALDTLKAEAKEYAADTLRLVGQALAESKQDLGCTMLAKEPYADIESQPFDRVIMEKTGKGAVLGGSFGWSDLGSWKTLWYISDKDETQTAKEGAVITHDVTGSYLKTSGPTLAVLGVKNLSVVATKDSVLIMPLDRAQDVRELVAKVDKVNPSLAREHPRVMRPWGSYEGIAQGARYQVKRLIILPGRSISLQKHHHRAEHWIVVSGTAKVECDGEVKLVHPNQSTYIPLGAVHRLSNPGLINLELIEVQSGDYLGEDDIVRLADNYGRS